MPKLLFILRLLAAAPLLAIGVQHLTGAAPMLPILEGAGFPMPELGAKLAPIGEVVAGLALLLGIFPRIGAMIALGSMSGALVAHLTFDHANFKWVDEPPMVLPIAVMLFAATILVKGPGALAMYGGPREVD
jgi:putative oxidoreductase